MIHTLFLYFPDRNYKDIQLDLPRVWNTTSCVLKRLESKLYDGTSKVRCVSSFARSCELMHLVSTLHQHLGRQLVKRWLISDRRQAIECQSIHMSPLTLGQLSTDCRLSVNWVSNEISIECWSSIDCTSFMMLIKCPLRCRLSIDQRAIKDINQHLTVNAFS